MHDGGNELVVQLEDESIPSASAILCLNDETVHHHSSCSNVTLASFIVSKLVGSRDWLIKVN